MDIAALSIALSQASVRQEASVSIMKKTMDQAESTGEGLVKLMQSSNVKAMEQSVHSHIGGTIDSKV
ncbi:YjfB family protein [Planomicrobium sp. CPCC 101110]|uniref:YjfB family protein n=1 Tax=Planomicrobium sp. CPCC 101110 TaxID=2599619 RepID=UPI0011B81374|nr:YjfB family protein [Planomicrobium sp. CPCC 101110]TWT27804.1 putative motility protein [Planomicrobium sp. CPCC 101110]